VKFTLSIRCDNAAFTENLENEIARILRVVTNRLDRGIATAKLLDANGNTVGSFALDDEGETRGLVCPGCDAELDPGPKGDAYCQACDREVGGE
jgi:hypothetical protein